MLVETGIIISLSMIAAYFVSKLGFHLLGDLISQDVKDFNNPMDFGLFIVLILLFTLVVAGIYTSWLITKVNAIDIFRGKGSAHVGN